MNSEHIAFRRLYRSPIRLRNGRWIVVETDEDDLELQVFSYPTESAAHEAQRALLRRQEAAV